MTVLLAIVKFFIVGFSIGIIATILAATTVLGMFVGFCALWFLWIIITQVIPALVIGIVILAEIAWEKIFHPMPNTA